MTNTLRKEFKWTYSRVAKTPGEYYVAFFNENNKPMAFHAEMTDEAGVMVWRNPLDKWEKVEHEILAWLPVPENMNEGVEFKKFIDDKKSKLYPKENKMREVLKK